MFSNHTKKMPDTASCLPSDISKPGYLHVETEEYLFIPHEKIPSNIQGFITCSVCECVCGFIKSSKGFAFFHFYRMSDVNDLMTYLIRDFANASDIKITLLGANPNIMFFPWKCKNRKLTLTKQGDDGVQKLKDEAAMQGVLQEIEELGILQDASKYYIGGDFYREQDKMRKQTISTMAPKFGFFKFNYALMNQQLKEKGYVATGFDGHSTFLVRGVKDLVAYQNLSRIIGALGQYPQFHQIEHYHCPVNSTLYVSFDGDYGLYFCYEEPYEVHNRDKEFVNPITLTLHSEQIKRTNDFTEHTSLNKQELLDSFRYKP